MGAEYRINQRKRRPALPGFSAPLGVRSVAIEHRFWNNFTGWFSLLRRRDELLSALRELKPQSRLSLQGVKATGRFSAKGPLHAIPPWRWRLLPRLIGL